MKYSHLRAFEKHVDGCSPQLFSAIYMILGKDNFLRKSAENYLKKSLLKDQNHPTMAFKTLDGHKLTLEELSDELQGHTLFSPRKVLLIEQTDKLPKALSKSLEEYFKKPTPSLFLILSATSISHATNLYKHAEKIGVVLEFPEEKQAEKERNLVDWLQVRLGQANKSIDQITSHQLVKAVGADAALLNMEIEKLICYVGERKQITIQDVNKLCSGTNQESIWQLGDALFRRDAPAALRISKALQEEGLAFLALLRQIRNQFQTDFQICSLLSEGGTPEAISVKFPYMKGFILDKHMKTAREYGLKAFKQSMHLIDEMELMAKNSSLDNTLLTELLIVKLVTHDT